MLLTEGNLKRYWEKCPKYMLFENIDPWNGRAHSLLINCMQSKELSQMSRVPQTPTGGLHLAY